MILEYLPLLNLILTFIIVPLYRSHRAQEQIILNQQKEIELLKQMVKELKDENEHIKRLVYKLADAETLKNHIFECKK